MRGGLISLVAALAACQADTTPDARLAPQVVADARANTLDAAAGGGADAPATADAAINDAPITTADARPIDASPPPPDAPPAPPDAPLPMGPAGVLLNELSPNFDSGHDLIELLVIKSGTAKGIQLEKDYPRAPVVLAVLPDVIVYKDQIIVVHLRPAGTTAAAETLAVDEKSTVANFDGAWDFLGNEEDIQFNNRVVSVRAADDTVVDAVPMFRADLTDVNDARNRFFPTDLQGIVTGDLWGPACDPSPCTYASNLAELTIDCLGAGTDTDADAASGTSLSRKGGGVDTDTAADWKPTPASAPFNTYGAPN